MAFTSLVLCVDTSGSMGGDKLKNAKKILSQTAASFNCTTKYYKFDTDITAIDKTAFDALSAGGGTRIEHAINKLYNDELPQCKNNRTKFFFVTDAEDQIADPEACKSAKRKCEQLFKASHPLDSEAILTGSAAGSCASILRDIFGADAFQTCTDEKFKNTLTNMGEGIAVSNKVASTVPGTQKKSADSVQQNRNNLQKTSAAVQSGSESADKVVNNANIGLEQTGNIHNILDSKMPEFSQGNKALAQSLKAAKTDDEKDTVEDAIEAQLTKTKKEGRNVVNAEEKKLDTLENSVKAEVSVTKKIAEKFKKNTDKTKQQFSAIVSDIADGVKELNTLTAGSKAQIQDTKTKFSEILTNLEEQVSNNVAMADNVDDLRKKFRKTLKNLRQKRIKNDEYKKQIKAHQKELNELLGQLGIFKQKKNQHQ